MFICDNLSSEESRLFFSGQDVTALAKQYGTPLFLMDEDRIRKNLRTYQDALRKEFGENAGVLYAGKACSFRRMYEILTEEDCGTDVVSPGEIHTAYSAGFDLSRAVFHGNNKTDRDIAFAMDKGVGIFAADNEEEIEAIDREAGIRRIKQQVLLRITPGIDVHTYEAVNTGKVDSKFGNAIATHQAEAMVRKLLSCPNIVLAGFHCHVGSQVFTEDVFERAAGIMLEFIADMKKKTGYEAKILDLGGGYGVRYTESDPLIDIPAKIHDVALKIREVCSALKLKVPVILMEPGRSIAADAGMTVYTVGSVKRIPGYKNYVSVDGGMTDNPRYALYRSAYTVLPASRMDEERDMECDLVGRCCESGDILQPGISLPSSMKRGDLVAVLTTGAYNYSMASLYNRIPRPPVVMLREGKSYTAVKRETVEDLTALDL